MGRKGKHVSQMAFLSPILREQHCLLWLRFQKLDKKVCCNVEVLTWGFWQQWTKSKQKNYKASQQEEDIKSTNTLHSFTNMTKITYLLASFCCSLKTTKTNDRKQRTQKPKRVIQVKECNFLRFKERERERERINSVYDGGAGEAAERVRGNELQRVLGFD